MKKKLSLLAIIFCIFNLSAMDQKYANEGKPPVQSSEAPADVKKMNEGKKPVLYTLVSNPTIKRSLHDIRSLIKDEKSFHEQLSAHYTKKFPSRGKNFFYHAIQADDAPFISAVQKYLTSDERRFLVRCAAERNKIKAMLSLIPKSNGESNMTALFNYFKKISKLTIAEIVAYRKTVENNDRSTDIYQEYLQKVVSTIHTKKGLMLPVDAQRRIQEMLHPYNAVDNEKMHPELQEAIRNDDASKIKYLLNNDISPYCPDIHMNMQAVELAVFLAKPQALWALLGPIRYLSDEKIKALISIVEQQKQKALQLSNKREKEEYIENIKYIEDILIKRLPAKQAEANHRMIQALEGENIGKLLSALQSGANPNHVTEEDGNPVIALACMTNPAALQLLLYFGANLRATVQLDPNDAPILANNRASLATLCLLHGPSENLALLLAHGADKDEMALIDAHENIQVTLLALAIEWQLPDHVQALLRAGVNPNQLTFQGYPLAYLCLNEEPIYLEMLLNHGADPLTPVVIDTHLYSLAQCAAMLNKPEHLALIKAHIAKNQSLPSRQ